MNNENLQRGMPQNLAMRLAGRFNWIKRSIGGFKKQLTSSDVFHTAASNPEYSNMSDARKEHLDYLENAFKRMATILDQFERDIDRFYDLPKYTPEQTAKLKQGITEYKKVSKARKAPHNPQEHPLDPLD